MIQIMSSNFLLIVQLFLGYWRWLDQAFFPRSPPAFVGILRPNQTGIGGGDSLTKSCHECLSRNDFPAWRGLEWINSRLVCPSGWDHQLSAVPYTNVHCCGTHTIVQRCHLSSWDRNAAPRRLGGGIDSWARGSCFLCFVSYREQRSLWSSSIVRQCELSSRHHHAAS